VDVLTAEERALVKKVRDYMESKVQPIINKYWADDAFPFELLPSFRELKLGGLGYQGYDCAGGSQKLFGFVAMELARTDASFCTFFGVHSGLAMGSIYLDGSEEQKRKWLPPMARFENIGCFGLTEPLVGSGTSGGLTTTAERDGDVWILNGQKRWIGNSPWCDVSIIWARDLADDQVKGFIVENKTTPGFSVEKMEHKMALKVVQNGEITLKDVRVPEANRLQGGNSFRDTARVLRMTRYMVGWASTGIQMGAYEATLKYAQQRLQFGRPIASFQMVQDLLARMLANVTACQCLMVRLAQMNDDGKLGDHHAALAKAFCTAKSRETVSWGRELLGGNGILADYNVARFFADAEALYSYEGALQMQNLIVGKAITGIGAFVWGCPRAGADASSRSFPTGESEMASAMRTPASSPESPTAALNLANVLYGVRDAIAYVTVNRPQVLNALNTPTWSDLRRAFERARDDAAVRGVILTGAGDKAFIAGADITELAQVTALEAEQSSRFGQEVLDLIENLGKPVIAAVNGFALGGGCETAMACTIRLAVETAKFGQPEVALGLIPGGGGTQRLPRLIGKGRALRLILSGEMIGAQEAFRIGLVNEIIPAAELIARAEAILKRIAANAPIAVKFALEATNKGMEASQSEGLLLEASYFGLCAATEDKREGTSAFLEKRVPQFRGR
jgi:glutaryl-CoA dehydrogenase